MKALEVADKSGNHGQRGTTFGTNLKNLSRLELEEKQNSPNELFKSSLRVGMRPLQRKTLSVISLNEIAK